MSGIISHSYCVDCDGFHPMNGCATYQSVKAGIADAKAGRITDVEVQVTAPTTGEREPGDVTVMAALDAAEEFGLRRHGPSVRVGVALVKLRRERDALRADLAHMTAELEHVRRGWLARYVDHIGWIAREYDSKADALATAQREAARLREALRIAPRALFHNPMPKGWTVDGIAEALTPAPEAGR